MGFSASYRSVNRVDVGLSMKWAERQEELLDDPTT